MVDVIEKRYYNLKEVALMIGRNYETVQERAKRLNIPKKRGKYYLTLLDIHKIATYKREFLQEIADHYGVNKHTLETWISRCGGIKAKDTAKVHRMIKLRLSGEFTWLGIKKRL